MITTLRKEQEGVEKNQVHGMRWHSITETTRPHEEGGGVDRARLAGSPVHVLNLQPCSMATATS